MSDVKVNLTIGVRNKDQLREVSQALAQLRQNAGSGGGAVTKELESIGGGVGKLKGTLGGLKGALGAVVGGAGLGRYGALAGLGGGTALLAAGAGLVAQGVRMALQFERAATTTASQLSIGAGHLTESVAAIKQAARQGPQFGYSSVAMAQMIGAYGGASGTTAGQAVRAAPWVAQYAKTYGLDLNSTGAAAGTLTQFAGQDSRKNLSEVFGAAGMSGASGRRIEEFIGTATQLIQAMQTQQPGQQMSLDDVLRLQVGVNRAGGIFGTAQGQIMGVSALAGVTQGMMGDPLRISMARRAGISMKDIMEGNMGKGASNTKAILGVMEQTYGKAGEGKHQNDQLEMAMIGMFGQQQGAVLYNLLARIGGSKNITAKDIASGEAAMKKQQGEANKQPINEFDKAMASLETKLTDLGDGILVHEVIPSLTLLSGIINTNLIGKLEDLMQSQANLASIMNIASIASAAGGVGGILGMLKGMGGGGVNFIKRIFGPASKAGMPEDTATAWRAALTAAEGGGGMSGLLGAGLTTATASALMVALNGGVGGAIFANATGRGPGSGNNATENQQYYGYHETWGGNLSAAGRNLDARFSKLNGTTLYGRQVGGHPGQYSDLIMQSAKKWKVDPDFVASVLSQESDFHNNLTSPTGAQGLGQMEPDTWTKTLGRKGSRMNPAENIDATAQYLSKLLAGGGGSMSKALGWYYGKDKYTPTYISRVNAMYQFLHNAANQNALGVANGGKNTTARHPDLTPGSPTFGQPVVQGGTGKVQAGGQSFDVKVTVVPSGPPVKRMPTNGSRTQSR